MLNFHTLNTMNNINAEILDIIPNDNERLYENKYILALNLAHPYGLNQLL